MASFKSRLLNHKIIKNLRPWVRIINSKFHSALNRNFYRKFTGNFEEGFAGSLMGILLGNFTGSFQCSLVEDFIERLMIGNSTRSYVGTFTGSFR